MMRLLKNLPLLLTAFTAVSTHAAEAKYILFLTADGFRTDYLEWYDAPHLKQLAAEGVRVLNARPVFPTVITPNMRTRRSSTVRLFGPH